MIVDRHVVSPINVNINIATAKLSCHASLS